MSGKNLDLTDDNKILAINSPKNSIGGPYKVLFKNLDERWVIVALKWNNQPRLAMRWFWGNSGNPFSSANPTWFIIPESLSIPIINSLSLNLNEYKRITDFLYGKIDGSEL